MWLPCHCSSFLQVSCVDLVPVAPGCLWTICSALDLVKLALAYYSSGVSWSVRTATAVVSFRTTTALLSMHLSMAVFIFSAVTPQMYTGQLVSTHNIYIPAGAAVIGVSLFVLILDIGHPSELRAFVFYAEVRMCVHYVHVYTQTFLLCQLWMHVCICGELQVFFSLCISFPVYNYLCM